MKWVFLFLIVILGGAVASAAIGSIYRARKHVRSWRAPAEVLGGVLCLVGVMGFFGAAFASLGGLDWLGSFQWPVGRATGVVALADGTLVVPHMPSGRIQLYDANRRFLRGWRIEASGGIFTPRITADQRIEVFTARGDRHFVYDVQGNLLSQSTYDYRVKPSPLSAPPDAHTVVLPTSWYAWPLTSPFYAWTCLIAAMGTWALVDRSRFSFKALKPAAA